MKALSSEEKRVLSHLKAKLWLCVGEIVRRECVELGVEATGQFTAGLVELVYLQLLNLGEDLEGFAG